MEVNESSLLIWDFNENDELVQITFDDYCAKENILAYEEKETLINVFRNGYLKFFLVQFVDNRCL